MAEDLCTAPVWLLAGPKDEKPLQGASPSESRGGEATVNPRLLVCIFQEVRKSYGHTRALPNGDKGKHCDQRRNVEGKRNIRQCGRFFTNALPPGVQSRRPQCSHDVEVDVPWGPE